MAGKLELMLEAEKRGILPEDKQVLLTEARKRGLIPSGKPVKAFDSFTGGAADMASFGFNDELQGLGHAIASKIQGQPSGNLINEGIDRARAEASNQQEQNPKSYTAGQITGAILPAIATRGRSIVEIGGPVTRAATSGGIQGGLYGLGTGQDTVTDRLAEAAKIGSLGAVGGAGIAYGLSLLGRTMGSAASKLAGGVDKVKGTAPEQVDTATKKVIDKLRADFPDDTEFAKALSSATEGGSLAELAPQGGQVQRLTRGAAQYPSGEKAITETLTDRASGASQRVKQGVKDYVSPNTDSMALMENIYKRGAEKSAPAYEKAFSQKPVSNDKIAEFVSQPELKTGIARGLKIQRLESLANGKPFNPSDYGITGFNEAGDPIMGAVPNMRLLDAGKRGLDAMIQDETNAVTGRVSDLGRALVQFKKSYVNELKASNKDYQGALDASGDYLSNAQALRDGRDFLKMDADVISKSFKKFGPTERESFKAGIARSIRDTIDNSPDGVDISKRILGKEEVRNKLKAVMSPKEYDELANTVRAEEKIFKLQKFVLGNSTTTSKAMDAADLSSEAQEVLQSLATQGPTAAISQSVVKAVRKTFSGLNDRTAGQVAKILMETDPQKKLMLLNKVKALPKGESQKALEAFFQTNKAVNAIRKAGPTPDLVGKAAGAATGSANEPPRITVRPSDRNLTTTQP